MALKTPHTIALAAAAAFLALGAGAPAKAGGGHYYGHVGYYHGYYGKPYYGGHRHYHHHYHRRHHRGGGGGKAAAIALGVIGGAILINEVAESRARERYYRDRYHRDRYAARATATPYYPARTYDPGPTDGNLSDDTLEGRLDGGPEPIRSSIETAYKACTRHARAALADRGFVLAAPSAPETADDIGGAWKMTATVLAEDRRGESWSRAMYCEADDNRVYLLELI